MRSIALRLGILCVPLTLAGCVAGQSLGTTYEHPAAAESVAKPADGAATVLVAVTDERAYVKSGDKPPHYLGKYRAGFGNPWDVSTENDQPLASILARDLATDLASLGYEVKSAAPVDRQIAVAIREWNFDGYQNGKLWYDLEVSIADATGNVLATDAIKEQTEIKGTFWMGARGGFEREMPKIYPAAIRKLVRDNAKISGALAQGGK
jgi:hypothetical protein